MAHNFYVARPIERWPGPMTQYRRTSPFFAEWWRTLELLETELGHLKARNATLHMAITEFDIRSDGGVRPRVRPEHPGVILTFDSKHGSLQYVCDKFDDWQGNVRAIALSLQALRMMDRYGVTGHGEQYTGWKAIADKRMTRREAEDLIRSYGSEAEAVRRTHPDHGGKREDFDRVIEARKLLRGAT
jgi:hypothetical protein